MPATSPEAALGQILDAVGIDAARAHEARIVGTDPILPTRFLMGTAGTAVLSAVGLAAADLWKLRGGDDQIIDMDARRGALALRTSKYLRVDGRPAEDYWDPISGFHQTNDGWVQLHCQFPHFRDGVLKVLGCAHDRDAVTAELVKWSGQALEDRMAEEASPVFRMRSHDEWHAHPQAKAVGAPPLIDIIKLGDSPPEPMPVDARPLGGIKVLDLTRVIAGPMTGRTLAEHGADVLRISGPHLPFTEPLVMDTGHGKRAAYIDLREDIGQGQLMDLVRGADVFSQSYRPGTLAGRGYGPEELAEIRPGLIYVTLSAWSHAGPWANRRGYDSLVQCATGIADENGAPEGPKHLPGQALDYITGYLGAFGAMVALSRRARDGGSYLVRLSLAQTATWLNRLGRMDGSTDPRKRADLERDDILDLLMETDTPWGRMEHLGPVLGMSLTPPTWERPAVPLGTHPPEWMDIN
ncbi:MAG: CoA transferase [Rhodospirillaceae bacterium]|nr:CoA transferase [Rhodospirillaceae bacterium]